MDTYIVAVNDTFRVEAESPEAAERKVAMNVGQEPFLVYDTQVQDEI